MNPVDNPFNRREVLTLALILAVTAPSEEQSQRALALVKQIATDMPQEDIDAAKLDAERRLAEGSQ
jgi:hypothetical protein